MLLNGAPSIWDETISLDEFEAAVHAWRLGRPAPAPRRRSAPPRPTTAPPRPASTPTPAAHAYTEGARAARVDALKVIAVCAKYGKPELAHQLVSMSPAEAEQFVISAMWGDAFTKARATASWDGALTMPRRDTRKANQRGWRARKAMVAARARRAAVEPRQAPPIGEGSNPRAIPNRLTRRPPARAARPV